MTETAADGSPPPAETHPNQKSNNDGPKKVTDAKRVLACGTCRKRKLKCDSKRPKCSTCARLGHPCEYDEVRKKSGPKRGYVKTLEARLNQLESLLDSNKTAPVTDQDEYPVKRPSLPQDSSTEQSLPVPEIFPQTTMTDTDLNLISDFGMTASDFPWDMVSLGLEEPLPSQEIMDELYQVYFEKVHPSLPMIHRPRFLASLSMAPSSRPPVCLRYAILAHACSVSQQYTASAEQFYQKARKYIEQDEMRGHGESFISVAHAQTWNLIACYEFKHMYFPRAWLSVGRAGRLSLMLGLHRQDRVGLDVKQTLAPPKDWIDREERRRTFWISYCHDRYASIGTGWPMMMEESDILTSMPASEPSFLSGTPEQNPMLTEIMKGDKTSSLSSLGSIILLATLFGRNLTHLHRPGDDENDHDLNGEFWKRHRTLDNILLNTALSLPPHLRLPQGLGDPNIVFCNMNIHTSTICLHQAAIFKADRNKLTAQISAESKRRCLVAADQITSIMRMICHQDLSGLNPFLAFCLYVAARVFVQYLKFKRTDQTVRSSLIFLLSAMQALKARNPLTESFLVQLDVDLEGSGLDIPSPMANIKFSQRPAAESPVNTDAVKCCPLVEIRNTNNNGVDQDGLERQRIGRGLPQDVQFDSDPFNMVYGQGPGSQAADHRTGGDHAPFFGGQPFTHQSPVTTNSSYPTPGSSNQRSSITGTTPPQSGEAGSKNGLAYDPVQVFDNLSSQSNTSRVPQATFTKDWNMSSEYEGISPTSRQKQGETSTPQNLESSFRKHSNGPDSQMNFTSNESGLTPGPTGFTPWQTSSTGLTPGPTGMTPGAHTGLTPMSNEWQNMDLENMDMGIVTGMHSNDGNNDWMSHFS